MDAAPALDGRGLLVARAHLAGGDEDAIVAATAVELAPSVVITGDTSDLALLVEGFVKVSEP